MAYPDGSLIIRVRTTVDLSAQDIWGSFTLGHLGYGSNSYTSDTFAMPSYTPGYGFVVDRPSGAPTRFRFDGFGGANAEASGVTVGQDEGGWFIDLPVFALDSAGNTLPLDVTNPYDVASVLLTWDMYYLLAIEFGGVFDGKFTLMGGLALNGDYYNSTPTGVMLFAQSPAEEPFWQAFVRTAESVDLGGGDALQPVDHYDGDLTDTNLRNGGNDSTSVNDYNWTPGQHYIYNSSATTLVYADATSSDRWCALNYESIQVAGEEATGGDIGYNVTPSKLTLEFAPTGGVRPTIKIFRYASWEWTDGQPTEFLLVETIPQSIADNGGVWESPDLAALDTEGRFTGTYFSFLIETPNVSEPKEILRAELTVPVSYTAYTPPY